MEIKELSLEQIADKLLEGKINPSEAEDLAKERKSDRVNCASSKIVDINGKKEMILGYDGHLAIIDENSNDKAYVEFYWDTDVKGNNFLYLEQARSYEEGNGYFRSLFHNLEDLAKNNDVSHIELEVDFDNVRARKIYERLGFYDTGKIKDVLVSMRKDLFDCE